MIIYLIAEYSRNYRLSSILLIFPVVIMAYLAVPLNSAAQDASAINACDLFTQTDAQIVLGQPTDAGSSRTSMMPSGSRCHYTYKQDGAVYGIKITIANDQTIAKEGMFESAADNFNRQKRTRKKHEFASQLFTQLENLGDDAFWSGSMLWVQKGGTLLIIDSDAHLSGSFKGREEADKARKELDLKTSITAAQMLLEKLP